MLGANDISTSGIGVVLNGQLSSYHGTYHDMSSRSSDQMDQSFVTCQWGSSLDRVN